jgi:hypothetical protein
MSDGDGYFGELVAATYDESVSGRAGSPCRWRRGVPVHGIDISRAMVARLRAKPGDAIGVTVGDFATTRVEGTFSVAYLVFNTIMNLTTQAGPAQAAARPGGGAVPRQPHTGGIRRL